MNKILRLILSFLIITLISNSTFATVSYEEKESRETSYSARKFRRDKVFDKVQPSKFISNSKMMNKVRKDVKVPSSWDQKITKDGKGLRFAKPGTNRADEIRIMPPNKNLPYTSSQVPNVRLKKDGKWRDIDGNVVDLQSEASHIPLEGFKVPDWLK